MGQGSPCLMRIWGVGNQAPPIREENAKVENPFGRGQALQQDRHRQDQAGPDEDSAHPYFKITKSETQAGPHPAGFRRRLQEGSAHDSLRLIAAPSPGTEIVLQGLESATQVPGELD